MSFQDSSLTPTIDDLIDINMLLGDIGEEETMDLGNLEIGELIDLELLVLTNNTAQNTPTENIITQNNTTQNTTNTHGLTHQVDQDQSSESRGNAFGKALHPKKIVVHTEVVLIEGPDGIKKWKCIWYGKL